MKSSIPVNLYYYGHEKCPPGHFFGPAVRQHYLMHFILDGQGIYKVNDKSYAVSKGMAFLIYPGETTFYQADEISPWEYIWIAMDGDDIERLIAAYHSPVNKYLFKAANYSQSADLFRSFADVNNLNLTKDKDKFIGLIYLIFSSFEKNCNTGAFESDLDYYNRSCKYIRLNYGYNISITDIAENVGLERSYLYRIFMKYAYISPKHYLTKVKVESAGEMLMNSELSMTEIALSCGFNDSSNFCRTFNKYYGYPPLQFKKQKNKN